MSASTRVRLLQGSGVLLILLGIVHLAATPHIAALIRHSASPDAADQLAPPMLLNHILVGLLLFPLGYLTIYAAPSSAAGLSWAQMIVRTTALTIATLPVTLLALMGVRYFDAPLFVLGAPNAHPPPHAPSPPSPPHPTPTLPHPAHPSFFPHHIFFNPRFLLFSF